ncbi:MAG: HAMP domain-containing sensor histidine kinase [Polyangiaceae bacterium]
MRRHRHRTLRSRLLLWFLGAILLAMTTSALVVVTTRPDPVTGIDSVARNVATRLAERWDDPGETRAFVGEIRDVSGAEVRVVRDLRELPRSVRRVAERGGSIAPQGVSHFFIPVTRGSELLGALEIDRVGPRSLPWGWWRFALAITLVVFVLSAMAGHVANQLATPLERLAEGADRLGGGDLGFRTDIARGALRWTVREVRDVAVSFNRMADRVEAMVRGQRELLGAISHELRSPLGRARVALEIARDRLPSDATERAPARALDDVEVQLGAVDTLLGDLLEVTRAGLADLRREQKPLLGWLRTRIAEEPRPPAIELQAPPVAESLEVSIDPVLLSRAVHNLLANARAHGHPPHAPLRVSVEPGPLAVRVVVRDRGPGFAPGFVEKAFDPFVRGDAARVRPTEGAGHGLGLAIVRRVVEAHGGRVFARNAKADDESTVAGAEVGFELPLASPNR